jgi:hypothetical protein
MIELTNSYGRKLFFAPSAIAEIVEASPSSHWHGIRAVIRTFDGRTIEVAETASEIAKRMKGGES